MHFEQIGIFRTELKPPKRLQQVDAGPKIFERERDRDNNESLLEIDGNCAKTLQALELSHDKEDLINQAFA